MMDIYKLNIFVFSQESADCIYILINSKIGMLIDTGKKKYSKEVIQYLKSKKMYINYILLTHNHSDHTGGLLPILEYIKNEQPDKFYGVICWSNPNLENHLSTIKMIKELTDRNLTVFTPMQGNNEKTLFNENIKLLLPSSAQKYNHENLNKNSITISFRIGSRYVILTGDATKVEEERLIGLYPDILNECLIYKLGHHGSHTSSSEELLSNIKNHSLNTIFCSCRSKWTASPPSVEKIEFIEKKFNQKVICTGRDGTSNNIEIVCEYNESNASYNVEVKYE